KAVATFREMVRLQGGDVRAIDDPSRLPQALYKIEVQAPRDGFVSSIDCEAVGTACVILGGGREKKEDPVDPTVGIIFHKKIADRVAAGEALCTIHYTAESKAQRAQQMILNSYAISDAPPAERPPIVRGVIQGLKKEN